MSTYRFSEQKAVSLRHRIAEDIRRAIIEGKLKPGDRLLEVEMSKQMGVSRGPIREALRVLEQEGLIHSQPFKETVVAEFSTEEVVNVLIPIRLTVETYAMRKALPTFGEEDFAFLSQCLDSMRANGEAGDVVGLVESDLAFHEYIVVKSNVPNLMNIWSSIFTRIRLHFYMQDQNFEDISTVWAQHQPLLDTMRTGDVERACHELSRHIFDTNLLSLGLPVPPTTILRR
ncbi:GntR family transcriptional regulator [Paenibacillus sp.]|uniref:GntR family transcriptional regulator n=1 Tax=Paenibacillus sp. TaxID=58172 RepID=UPI002D49E611|nr:GntR family transcriptional regulator [Paenibacillus sp.]HZG57046.1 GntR family transcriptional regulator [Paenibacillus sp.]